MEPVLTADDFFKLMENVPKDYHVIVLSSNGWEATPLKEVMIDDEEKTVILS